MWLSLHIFYNAQHDALLLDAVGPLVRHFKERGWVDLAFFVRYWEGGPHVRLRLRGQEVLLQERVLPIVETQLSEYLARQPSAALPDEEDLRRLLARMHRLEYGVEGAPLPYPTNSVRIIPYEPEFDRYGGPAGVALAERHFDVSSAMALEALTAIVGREEQRLALGLEFMLQAVAAFELPPTVAARFFMSQALHWEKYLPEPRATLEERFGGAYALQRQALVARVRAVFRGGGAGGALLARWREELRRLHRGVVGLEVEGRLDFGALRASPMAREGTACLLLWSFLHMMNNRLGVAAAKESYLAFLLASALREWD